LLWASFAQIVLAIVFGAIVLTSAHRASVAAAGLAFEAVFYGGFMWWFGGARLQREVEAAPAVVDPEIRDGRTAARVFALTMVWVVTVLTIVALLSPGSPIVAGIALGGGAYCMGLHRWLVRWEAEHSVEVLRIPAWRRRKGINNYRIIHTASR
jgi:hypothetical protein